VSVSPGDRREVPVHPNSMAARKWGRKTWQTTLTPSLWARAAEATKAGELERASAIRAAATRREATQLHCG
jgi:hypothetical protein